MTLGTVAPLGFTDFPPGQWLPRLRRLGCSVVQAYRNPKASLTTEEMRQALGSCGMPCDSLHGIFGEQYDPSAPDESARRFAVATYKAEGELALALGGPLVVVHCSTIRRDGIPAEERALRVRQLEKSIAELGQFAQAHGLRYAFENLPPYHPVGWDVAELAAILDRAAAPNTGMCFDTGHANMVGDPVKAVASTGRQMIYVHLSGNDGANDSHQMPTRGSIDLAALGRQLRLVGYSGTVMLEVFASVQQMQEFVDQGFAQDLARLVESAGA